MEKLLSTEDIAEQFGVEPVTVRRWALRGKIKGYKIGKAWRFRPSDVENYIQGK